MFCGPDGGGGNKLGVVQDGASVPGQHDRQAMAKELGYSETVFVDDAEKGAVDIYTPSVRLPFAGHPLVGAAWLLARAGVAPAALYPPAGPVPTWVEGDFTWIRGHVDWAAGRHPEQYDSGAAVEALPAPPECTGWLYAWAWRDEAAGTVRTRAFPRRGDGIVEDEATGAAAVVLTHHLGRALDVWQGVGSQILTQAQPDGWVAVGGRVSYA
ncbi:PhzF family phenazine biosynthesis protein [Fodinicola feengrottensis]|uniref:PhzF family phenazine biosynthesis protein n=1 Tax=Fodinicola feengrottensis TaxID=435914 RepID=UPI0013D6530B|nr:PhzF family phenazine biosynthesis protein [Fodinicola feengrottensis]